VRLEAEELIAVVVCKVFSSKIAVVLTANSTVPALFSA
jgi:hypothetical protein